MKIIVFIFLFLSTFFANADAIKIGVLQFAPPFSSMAQNHYYGLVIDIADALCKQLKEQCTFVPSTIEKQYTLLEKGDVDLTFMPSPITDEILQKYSVSLPYFISNAQFLVLKTAGIKSINELKNYKIGVIKSSLYKALITLPYITPANVKAYNKAGELIAGITTKDVDAIFINDVIAKYIVNNAGLNLTMVGDKVPVGKGYGIIALKKNAELIKRINKVLLKMMEDGSYLKIYSRYF